MSDNIYEEQINTICAAMVLNTKPLDIDFGQLAVRLGLNSEQEARDKFKEIVEDSGKFKLVAGTHVRYATEEEKDSMTQATT